MRGLGVFTKSPSLVLSSKSSRPTSTQRPRIPARRPILDVGKAKKIVRSGSPPRAVACWSITAASRMRRTSMGSRRESWPSISMRPNATSRPARRRRGIAALRRRNRCFSGRAVRGSCPLFGAELLCRLNACLRMHSLAPCAIYARRRNSAMPTGLLRRAAKARFGPERWMARLQASHPCAPPHGARGLDRFDVR